MLVLPALDNFLRSLAGCCVMTYVLGVGDRHNDNIMIRYSGHVFHVDFAKVFGNVQTFAGFKRDRVPFVLTQDMLHVLQAYSREISEASGAITGFGNAPSSGAGRSHNSNREGVQLFIDYCCEAYNLIRKHSYALLSILEMGLTMDIPGVTLDSVRYVMRALKLNLSEQQASQHFTELIRKTLQSKLPALNFFVHGLAQVKQASSGGGVSGTGPGSPNVQTHSPRSSMSRMENRTMDMSPDRMNPSSNIAGSRTAPHNNTGQLLSFNPKRFSYTQDGHIDAVVVEAAVKKKPNDKHLDHYFPMYVWRKNCRVPTRVYRRIADLNELSLAVQETYTDSPVLAILPHLLNALNSGNVTSVKTQNNVQTLVDTLLEEDEVISKSDLVYTFFHSVLFDERFSAEDAAQLTAGSSQMAFWAPTQLPCELPLSSDRSRSDFTLPLLTPSVATIGPAVDPRDFCSAAAAQRVADSLPALQLELCLSENMQQLDLLIKHGRALLIPGSNELPDVYVKVYLLSGRRRKSTKRKTAIIRRSSSPSFNTTFTYELTPHDVQVGFLEISAWHAVNLGENFSLGQVYIQLRSLTPGRSSTKWYPLNSDWDTV
ncbi:unnamed protein product [Echinostoma caproni]|uniref:PI3K/PI4K domain-containing protein n=1 Tax=Echinostoma caproni TaxID=27848 RepID=A0A183AG97_9TREM|nr:unnamed protein product [Echinostoma caproni]